MAELVHCFEQQGLGKAPFTYVGCETASDRAAVQSERRGAGLTYTPNLCGGSCDYCGTAIFNVFWIDSANGKRFKVGCECVKKTGDEGLVRKVEQAVRDLNRQRRHAKKMLRESDARQYCEDQVKLASATLAAHPHPNAHHASQGKTLLDYARWMLAERHYLKLQFVIKAALKAETSITV